MNIVQLQDQLKNFSQDQLVREMQAPSGNAPQFLVLGEIMRRKRMQDDFTAQKAKGDQGTVAQEAVAAAGVPQGGIADMARAMAPSTDMTQNTGVVGMYAGGPVKKMAKGDKVKTDPAVIAMANRAGMSVDEYLDAVGKEEAARIEAGAARRAERGRMMAFEPMGDGATFPSQADLDRRFQEEQFAFDASRPLTTPAAIDMPTMPSIPAQTIGAPAAGLPAIAGVPEMPGAPFYLLSRDVAPEASTYVSPPPLPSTGPYSRVPSALELAQEEYDRTAMGIPGGEGFDERAYMAPAMPEPEPIVRGPASVRQRVFEEARRQGAPNALGKATNELFYGLSGETVADYEARKKAEAAAAEKASPGRADRDQQGIAAVPTPAEVKAAEDARVAEEAAAAAAQTAAATQGGTGGAGGGGAGGAGGMSSYEQELMDALGRREKAAEQDKWLALAQVGLNLMSSRAPTLAGAIGEAGLKGVEAARGARDQYDKDRLELMGAIEQSRMARAKAASGGGGGGIKLSQYLPQLRYAADAAVDRVSLLTGGMDPNMAITMAAEAGDNARAVEIKTAYNAALQANNDYTNAVRTIGGLEGFAPEEDDTSFSARQ